MKKESVDAIGLKQAGINFVSMLPDSDLTRPRANLRRPPSVFHDKPIPVLNLNRLETLQRMIWDTPL